METAEKRVRLPLEVRETIGARMHRYRLTGGLVVLSELVHDVQRSHLPLRLSERDLSDAIVEAAVASRLNIHFDRPFKPFPRQELARMEDDGARAVD